MTDPITPYEDDVPANFADCIATILRTAPRAQIEVYPRGAETVICWELLLSTEDVPKSGHLRTARGVVGAHAAPRVTFICMDRKFTHDRYFPWVCTTYEGIQQVALWVAGQADAP
jgi:hypothetical protein